MMEKMRELTEAELSGVAGGEYMAPEQEPLFQAPLPSLAGPPSV